MVDDERVSQQALARSAHEVPTWYGVSTHAVALTLRPSFPCDAVPQDHTIPDNCLAIITCQTQSAPQLVLARPCEVAA